MTLLLIPGPHFEQQVRQHLYAESAVESVLFCLSLETVFLSGLMLAVSSGQASDSQQSSPKLRVLGSQASAPWLVF